MNLFKKKEKNKELITAIKNIIGEKPDNIFLYQLAFSHSSVAKEVKDGFRNSNERLEFLGDALIDCVIAEYLFMKFPYRDEGFLTEMRSKIVSRENLNKLSIKLGLDKLLKVSKDVLQSQNKSVYGNAFEAFMGAIFLDKGYNKAKKILLNRIVKIHLDIEDLENTEINYKSKLIEWVQKEHHTLEFQLVQEIAKKGRKLYVINAVINNKIEGTGKDFTKKKAEQLAAAEAYQKIFSENQ